MFTIPRISSSVTVLILSCVFFTSNLAHAGGGRIVLANDEWTLANAHWSTNSAQFAVNVADWFAGGVTGNATAEVGGNFLVYSSNYGLTGTLLENAMLTAGHTWTVSTAVPFTLSSLCPYDGIFLAGPAAGINLAVLTEYVQQGGCVYLAGGTGAFGGGGAAAEVEAAFWNPFLLEYGMWYEPTYNTIFQSVPIASPHPLFAAVTSLFVNLGNGIGISGTFYPNQIPVALGTNNLFAVHDPVYGLPFCFGDNNPTTEPGVPACPCGSAGDFQHGCPSAVVSGGARLMGMWHGSDSSALHVDGLPPNSTVFFIGSSTPSTAVPFSHGITCIGGSYKRFGTGNADACGTYSFPLRFYTVNGVFSYVQALYRDSGPVPNSCLTPGYNLSNALRSS